MFPCCFPSKLKVNTTHIRCSHPPIVSPTKTSQQIKRKNLHALLKYHTNHKLWTDPSTWSFYTDSFTIIWERLSAVSAHEKRFHIQKQILSHWEELAAGHQDFPSQTWCCVVKHECLSSVACLSFRSDSCSGLKWKKNKTLQSLKVDTQWLLITKDREGGCSRFVWSRLGFGFVLRHNCFKLFWRSTLLFEGGKWIPASKSNSMPQKAFYFQSHF